MRQKDLLEQYGNEIPFKVPEKYFEQFSARFNERLLNEEKQHQMRPLRSLRVVAAVFIAVIIAGSAVFFIQKNIQKKSTQYISNAYYDELSDQLDEDELIDAIVAETTSSDQNN